MRSSREPLPRPVAALLLLAVLGILGMAAATALGFFGALWWVLDLAANFRMHYLVALAISAGIAAGLQRWGWASVGYVAFAANLAVVAPLYLPGAPAPAAGSPRLHVLTFNVHGGNPGGAAIARYILDESPDVAIISELRPEMEDQLREALPGYYFAAQSQRDNFGIGIATRGVANGFVLEHEQLPDYPGVVALTGLGPYPIYVLGLHPPPPVGAELARTRDRLLELAGDWVASAEGAVVMCGDLNASHWSHPFRRLLERAGLHDSARGRGVQPTWPNGLGALQIPIDHCLHSGELAVVDRRVGPWLSSDHRPLHVVFTLAK